MAITDPVYDVYGGMVQIKTEQYNELVKAFNDAMSRVAELEKEKAELQKDRERLDWQDNNQRGVVAIDCEDERGTTFMGFTAAADWDGPEDGWHKSIRQAIDNARE